MEKKGGSGALTTRDERKESFNGPLDDNREEASQYPQAKGDAYVSEEIAERSHHEESP